MTRRFQDDGARSGGGASFGEWRRGGAFRPSRDPWRRDSRVSSPARGAGAVGSGPRAPYAWIVTKSLRPSDVAAFLDRPWDELEASRRAHQAKRYRGRRRSVPAGSISPPRAHAAAPSRRPIGRVACPGSRRSRRAQAMHRQSTRCPCRTLRSSRRSGAGTGRSPAMPRRPARQDDLKARRPRDTSVRTRSGPPAQNWIVRASRSNVASRWRLR